MVNLIAGYDWVSGRLLLTNFWHRLFGTSAIWFCNDWYFYGKCFDLYRRILDLRCSFSILAQRLSFIANAHSMQGAMQLQLRQHEEQGSVIANPPASS